MTIHILYHRSCTDGLGAAWVAWRALGTLGVNYQAVQYSDGFTTQVQEGDHLYLLDFMYPVEVLEKNVPHGCRITVLDHHATQKPEWEKLLEARSHTGWIVDGDFDLSRSGAMLSWNWFNPCKRPPKLIEHIQDRDLWKFDLPFTDDIITGLVSTKDFNKFEVFDLFADDAGDEVVSVAMCETLKHRGRIINEKKAQDVATFVTKGSDKVKFTIFEGYKTALYNTTTLISDIGAGVLRSELDCDVSLSFFVTSEFKVIFSLRSNAKTSDADVSIIAKKYGGGGHRNAAGFSLSGQEGFKLLESLFAI